jgi:hypothetical protein
MFIVNGFLRWTSFVLAILALAANFGLLFGDPGVGIPNGRLAAAISAAPLLLIGVAFLAAQAAIRPRLMELFKNVLLAGTFLLWGAIQFLPDGALSKRLGNLVIVLYVVDLAWMTLGTVILTKEN